VIDVGDQDLFWDKVFNFRCLQMRRKIEMGTKRGREIERDSERDREGARYS